MADAVEVEPPATAAAAALAAGQSTPAGTRTGTVPVPCSGSMTVSAEKLGVATDDKGRTVHVAPHLAQQILDQSAAVGDSKDDTIAVDSNLLKWFNAQEADAGNLGAEQI